MFLSCFSTSSIGDPEIVKINWASIEKTSEVPTATINIPSGSIIFEGDIIDCDITGNPTIKYWPINNLSNYTTF